MTVIHNTLLSKISNDRFGFITYSFNQNIKTMRGKPLPYSSIQESTMGRYPISSRSRTKGG